MNRKEAKLAEVAKERERKITRLKGIAKSIAEPLIVCGVIVGIIAGIFFGVSWATTKPASEQAAWERVQRICGDPTVDPEIKSFFWITDIETNQELVFTREFRPVVDKVLSELRARHIQGTLALYRSKDDKAKATLFDTGNPPRVVKQITLFDSATISKQFLE